MLSDLNHCNLGIETGPFPVLPVTTFTNMGFSNFLVMFIVIFIRVGVFVFWASFCVT